MNWKNAWEQQSEFDNRVMEELNVKPTVADRCTALRIEMDELANELPEQYKWWSKKKNNYDAGLIEYADGLKFLIGLGLALGVDSKEIHVMPITTEGVKQLHSDCDWLSQLIERELSLRGLKPLYMELFSTYVKLGYEIGFTQDSIMQAFEDKHKVIHNRLDEAK